MPYNLTKSDLKINSTVKLFIIFPKCVLTLLNILILLYTKVRCQEIMKSLIHTILFLFFEFMNFKPFQIFKQNYI